MTRYARTASMFYDVPLALHPAKIDEIHRFLSAKMAGESLDWSDKQEPFAATTVSGSGGAVAVVPLYGVMNQRMNMMAAMSGGTSTEQFAKALREQVNNPQVKAVIIDVDSPGGSVYGTDELAQEIYSMRGSKPIIAVANSGMFSAAYYAMSQADEIVVTPGGELGSIGVYMVHVDASAAYEQEGYKPTVIRAGKYKAEGNPYEPLGDDAQAEFQAQVDRYYDMFLKAVARGRGVTVDKVRSQYGEGRIFGAKDAVSRGMADRVATLDQTIQRFTSGGRVSRRSAEDESPDVVADEAAIEPSADAAQRDIDMLTVEESLLTGHR